MFFVNKMFWFVLVCLFFVCVFVLSFFFSNKILIVLVRLLVCSALVDFDSICLVPSDVSFVFFFFDAKWSVNGLDTSFLYRRRIFIV